MDQGVCYTYQAAAYPRYRFYQQHLQRLCSRWQHILEAGSLPDCISQGRVRLKEILSLSRQIDDIVTVSVYADHNFLETGQLLLQCNQKVSGQTRPVSWEDFSEGSIKSSETSVTVIVLPSKEENAINDLIKQLSRVPKEELRKIIIYFAETKTSIRYTDVVKGELRELDVDTVTEKLKSPAISPNQLIQYLLEESAIFVLERIANYNTEFKVTKQEHEDNDWLESAIFIELMKSMRNSFVVKDLSPDSNDKPDEVVRKVTDEQLMKLSSALGTNWELLGPPLGLTISQLDDIKSQYTGVMMRCYKMLILWQQKEGSTLRYLFQLLKNFSHIVTVDMTVVKEIEGSQPESSAASDRNKIFHKKLHDFISKKTKCIVCDKLSLKYGISANLINEFLNEGFYGYEKKVEEVLNAMTLPSWPTDKSDDGVSTCRMFSYRCAANLTKMIRETEEYVKVKHCVLVTLKRLQFQLLGLLQETDIQYETKIPEIPKLPADLKSELLQLSEVYGCGTVWGDLMIQMFKDLTQYMRSEIETVLSKHMYTYGYMTEVIVSDRENAGGFCDIEHGHGLRAKKINVHSSDKKDDYEYGSLGCFVNITYQPDQVQGITSTNNTLHGLTCAHCVTDCDEKIEILKNETFVELGRKQHYIYEPNEFDVATILVDKQKATWCERGLKNCNQACVKNWKFEETPRVKTPVYKYGCKTGLTYGTCISVDYQKKLMRELNGKMENTDNHLHPQNNILISREDIDENLQIYGITTHHQPKPQQGEEEMETGNRETRFSRSGDSGSVVCKDGPNNDDCIHVLSLLTGKVKLKNGVRYSFSNPVHKTVKELENRFKCDIQPAKECIGAERL